MAYRPELHPAVLLLPTAVDQVRAIREPIRTATTAAANVLILLLHVRPAVPVRPASRQEAAPAHRAASREVAVVAAVQAAEAAEDKRTTARCGNVSGDWHRARSNPI